MNIPLHKPLWGSEAQQAVLRALRTGTGTADGPESDGMRNRLQTITKAGYAIPVTSCTHAMEAAVACLGTAPGDEIIVPSFTLSSTATAVVRSGATPVFADIDPVTYCLDPDDVASVITKRTVGIITVHYAGMAGPGFDRLRRLAKREKLWLVEDSAHAIGSFYTGRHLGTFGNAGALSFHGTKNVAGGEAGAILTDSIRLSEKMEIFRSIGTDRMRFLAGKVSAYRWVADGSSFMLSDILAALINIQLDQIDRINKDRQQIATCYTNSFATYDQLIRLPIVPKGMTKPNWHIYALTFHKKAVYDLFVSQMKKYGIGVSSHYVPLHESPMGKRITRKFRHLPATERAARSVVRMPIYAGMTQKELDYIVVTAQKILKKLL